MRGPYYRQTLWLMLRKRNESQMHNVGLRGKGVLNAEAKRRISEQNRNFRLLERPVPKHDVQPRRNDETS